MIKKKTQRRIEKHRWNELISHLDYHLDRFTFNDKQPFQAFWVVVFKHLEDLVTQRNILDLGMSTNLIVCFLS